MLFIAGCSFFPLIHFNCANETVGIKYGHAELSVHNILLVSGLASAVNKSHVVILNRFLRVNGDALLFSSSNAFGVGHKLLLILPQQSERERNQKASNAKFNER